MLTLLMMTTEFMLSKRVKNSSGFIFPIAVFVPYLMCSNSVFVIISIQGKQSAGMCFLFEFLVDCKTLMLSKTT